MFNILYINFSTHGVVTCTVTVPVIYLYICTHQCSQVKNVRKKLFLICVCTVRGTTCIEMLTAVHGADVLKKCELF